MPYKKRCRLTFFDNDNGNMKKFIAAITALQAGIIATACTSALIGAGMTRDGHALLWKHRDSGFERNFVERVAPTDSTAGYVALFNGGDSLLLEAWVGVNDRSFAIMNTASYNLAPDTASVKDREGLIMSAALRHCTTVDDFARMLDSLPRPLGVQANFGVVDATGAGAYFETDDRGYVRFDLPGDSLLVRTNFSCSGTCGEGMGRVRYANALHLFAPHMSARDFSPRLLTDTISRSFYHSGRGTDAMAAGLDEVEDLDLIPRRSTSASVVVEIAPEPTMWVILGYPPLSTARAVTPGSVPEEMRPTLPGAFSPLSDRNVNIRNQVIFSRGGRHFVNLRRLREFQQSN